ncbi:unnamed protein product [Orchesella dallaii]|uniref:CARD domain-containing protein n=1 Tax=Orchesella dallaii TaxID=48710 RepID=A0ABP1RH46_9HEXA
MNDSQIEIITRNLPGLISNTTCNSKFLAYFQQKDILSDEDVENLKAISVSSERNQTLYQLLKTRKGGFEELKHALTATKQSGVLELLQASNIEASANTVALPSNATPPNLFWKNMPEENITLSECPTEYETALNVTTLETEAPMSMKIRIVLEENLKSLVDKLGSTESNKIINDKFLYKNLSETQQQKLLQKTVEFQGIPMLLKELCDNYYQYTKNSGEHLLDKLNGKVLVQLLNGETPIISNGNAPPIPNNYIPRRLKASSHISRRILNITKTKNKLKKKEDILLFVGLELYELTGLAVKYGNGECSRSSNEIKRSHISCQIILLESTSSEYDEEFEKICKLTSSKPVHLFNCKKDEHDVKALEWKKSKGSLATLYEYTHLRQDCFDEDSLDVLPMMSFCIAELPGNGKTTLMAKYAQKLIAQKRHNFYTQYVVISEFVKLLIGSQNNNPTTNLEDDAFSLTEKTNSSNPNDIPVGRIFKVLSTTSCQSSFGQAYVKAFVKADGVNCDYMFDGFDELPQNQLQLALEVIAYLRREKKKYIRVWVTTRPDLLRDLEEKLGVLGYTIKPFEEEEQITILTTHWCPKNQEIVDNSKLAIFARHCLQGLKKGMTGDENDIAGIPLLCFLIAEVYHDDALAYSSVAGGKSENASQPEVEVSTIKLYEKFIEKRLQCLNVDSSEEKYDCLKNAHVQLAVKLLLPKAVLECTAAFPQGQDVVSNKELLSLGIIQAEYGSSAGAFRFVHKTIAEYLVAYSLHKMFQDQDLSLQNLEKLVLPFIYLCRHVLRSQAYSEALSLIETQHRKTFKFSHPNICHFLNLILLPQSPPTFQHHTLKLIVCEYFIYVEGLQNLQIKLWQCLHASIISNFSGITEFLIQCLEILFPIPEKKEQFCKEVSSESCFSNLLFFAAKYGSADVMRNVRIFFENWTKAKPIKQELGDEAGKTLTLLHVAVEAGNYPVADCLFNLRGYNTQIDDKKYSNLLHSCLLKSKHDSEVKLENKIQIIDLLMTDNDASYRQPSVIGKSIKYLMLQPINLKLLFCVLKNLKPYTIPMWSDNESEAKTLLHLLPTRHYDDLMTPAKYQEHLDCIKDFFDLEDILTLKDTHGYTAVDWAVSSLDLLEETLSIFDQYIKSNDSIIVKAIAGQRSSEFLRRLIKRANNWNFTSMGKTVLHFAAEKYNYGAIQLFTNDPYNVPVDAKDDDGNTALHICLRTSADKKDLGWSAAAQQSTDRRDSSDSNSSDESETEDVLIISGEVEPNNQHRIITHLISSGANILEANKQNKTPLHFTIDICKGLNDDDFKKIENVGTFDEDSLNLAYVGIILNEKIGSVWHPNLVAIFADKLRDLGADAKVYTENGRSLPLLHIAAKKHSMGVKYLLENKLADATLKDESGKTALEYMGCPTTDTNCTYYNCRNLKSLLCKYESMSKSKSNDEN